MKTTQTNMPTVGNGGIRQFIHNFHEQMKQKAYEKGRDDGIAQVPKQTDTSLNFYLEFLTTAYQTLYAECMEMLKPQLQIQLGSTEKKQAGELALERERTIEKLSQQNDADQKSIEHIPILVTVFNFSLCLIGTVLINAGETFMIAMSMQVLGKGMAFSLMIGAAVSFGLMLCATHLPMEINKLQSALLRKLARLALVLSIGVVMYYFASMRSAYITLTNGYTVSPFTFAVLNLLCFMGQYLLGKYFFLPIMEDVRAMFRALKIRWRITKRSHSIKKLQTEDKEQEQELNTTLSGRLTDVFDAEALPRLINPLYKESAAVYKASNASARKNPDDIPQCFHNPIPDLLFNPPPATFFSSQAVGLFLLLLFTLTGCIHTQPPVTERVIVLIDVTDSLTMNGKDIKEQVFHHLSINHDAYAGESISVSTISHFKNNPTWNISIPSTDIININEIERKGQIQQFTNYISTVIDSITSKISKQEESEVLYPIFTSLSKLAESNATRKVLLVFSDLRENTPIFSTYDPKVISELTLYPEHLIEILDSIYYLKAPLLGIEVIFSYTPHSTFDDDMFFTISQKVMKPYLEQHEAEVYSATLPRVK